jgi:NTP pyrophosphatase (non-canonical NTP hydrolase)
MKSSTKKGRSLLTPSSASLFAIGPTVDNVVPPPPLNMARLKPTAAYDTYWRFAVERQNVFVRRMRGAPAPWTEDPILLNYKFTNVYRASDRVSQYLIRNVIYREDLSTDADEIVFRILLFKLFNKIETWELLENKLGVLAFSEYSFKAYDQILSKAMARGDTIYSAAYIMPSGGSLGHAKKHRNHLALLEKFMRDNLSARLAEAPSMHEAFRLIRAYPTIGDFLGYQFVTDINYSAVTNFSEMEFVIPGPGAVDGIRKCFSDQAEMSNSDIIRFMAGRQVEEFERLGISFQRIGDRPLQLIDCQNLFCEVGKYARVKHPELAGASDRVRIKQRFRPTESPIDYWYPPKWEINEQVTSSSRSVQHLKPASISWHEASEAMNFDEYQARAARTDRNPATDDSGMMIPLLGLAGEAGEALSEYKKFLRDGESHTQFRERFSEELGDTLWYLSAVATRFGLNLAEIARRNLEKCQNRWGELPCRPAFDANYPDSEQFPRKFLVDFATTHGPNEKPVVQMFYRNEPFGNALSDNSYEHDGYGYHDAIHLSFAAVLGWSPLTRKLLGVKRKSVPSVDEVEDGGRAIATEEGVSAMIFAFAKDYNWLDGKASVSSSLLRMIRNMTAHLEVGVCTEGEWERAIIQGFTVWRVLRERRRGTIELDLDARRITLSE